jgi:hypothetical protein
MQRQNDSKEVSKSHACGNKPTIKNNQRIDEVCMIDIQTKTEGNKQANNQMLIS